MSAGALPRQRITFNGRGDVLSEKRSYRKAACAKYGVTSSRQWVRLRKALRRAARAS